MKFMGSSIMTLTKDQVCFEKKPELICVSLKQQTRYFITFKNDEEGAAQAAG